MIEGDYSFLGSLIRDSAFWVSTSFVLTVCFFGKYLWRAINKYIDSYRLKIEEELGDAKIKKDELQILFYELEQDFINEQKNEESVLLNTKEYVNKANESSKKEFDDMMNRSLKNAELNIKRKLFLESIDSYVDFVEVTCNELVVSVRNNDKPYDLKRYEKNILDSL